MLSPANPTTTTTAAAPKAEAPVRAIAVSLPEPAPMPVPVPQVPEPARPAVSAPPMASGLATWTDLESGRIVVQVVDHRTGQVLAQFPPEQILRTYPPKQPGSDAPSVEVEA